jgi:hypothetical protein
MAIRQNLDNAGLEVVSHRKAILGENRQGDYLYQAAAISNPIRARISPGMLVSAAVFH